MLKKPLKKSDFYYELPTDLVAKHPLERRTNSRLLVVQKRRLEGKKFSDLPSLLNPRDLVIVNNTKVIPARLIGKKVTGGKVEILIERVESDRLATCHVKASRGLKESQTVLIGETEARLVERRDDLFLMHFDEPVADLLNKVGQVPLPNYLNRPPTDMDKDRYQTVYAKEQGAVAAPTAGLHFSNRLLEEIKAKGVEIEPVTLHVGAGTFQSLREEDLSKVSMHSERYFVPRRTRNAIENCQGRVVAVGTTVVRTLETAARTGRDQGETSLFIAPGFQFHVVESLITNFHLPESTLIMLVAAFCGYSRVMRAYEFAVQEKFRFFSYGDAMWCERNEF